MNKSCIIYLIVFSFCCSITEAQELPVLMSWKPREHIYDYNLQSYYYNDFFRTTIKGKRFGRFYRRTNTEDSLLISDTTIRKYYVNSKPSLPPKIFLEEDFVYFNPAEIYICYDPPHIGSHFLLNKECYFKTGRISGDLILPNSLRFYVDTNDISFLPDQPEMVLDSGFKVPLDKYLQPFYFKKYEVTNNEYRQFVNWVLDSLIRQVLMDKGVKEFNQLNSSMLCIGVIKCSLFCEYNFVGVKN